MMEKARKFVGWSLIIISADILTPPYPGLTDGLLFWLFGMFTGTNSFYKEIVTGWNPFLWSWNVVAANPNPFIFTAILVYIIAPTIMILIAGKLLNRNVERMLNDIWRKTKRFFGVK